MAHTPRPPDDFDGVIDQVADALDELEIVEGPERNALLENLREVLGALDGLGVASVTVQGFEPEFEPPDIAVFQGGRAEGDAPMEPARRAELRIAPDADPGPLGDSEEGVHDADTEGAGGRQFPGLALRRVALPPRRSDPPLHEPPGAILLGPEPGGTAGQTLLLGTETRAYRIRCTRGILGVRVDGAPPFPLLPGQTADVEGRHLAVTAEEASEGRYIRLRSQAPR